jgi:hypothetical protein
MLHPSPVSGIFAHFGITLPAIILDNGYFYYAFPSAFIAFQLHYSYLNLHMDTDSIFPRKKRGRGMRSAGVNGADEVSATPLLTFTTLPKRAGIPVT